ncbi:hypothetical protein [Actinoallomurus acaciae]|uniref:Uncharacterized protein n=1 Tax=Actinoallomurus acaciae TaxID=502577 RepID=A0ABV5Y729_9ACTN
MVEIIRWLLTGRSAVDNWVFERIRRASLEFRLDGQPFTVDVTLDGRGMSGRLSQRSDVLRTFDQRSFETVMEELLLPRLGLDRISVFQRASGSERGSVIEAGWTLLSDGLHVRPSELSSVIGGVPVRAAQMLQVYLALPWYDTLLQVRAALGAVRQQNRDVEQATQAEHEVRLQETDRIQQELRQARLELAAMSDEQELADRLRAAVDRATELARAALAAGARVKAATQCLADAKDTQIVAQRALRTIVEREAAGAFFRALEPKACPRCTKPIDGQRRAHEAEEQVCSVCDRPAVYEPDVMARERAEEQVAATAEAVESAEQALGEAKREHEQIADERAATEREITSLAGSGELERRRAHEARLHRLEGRVEEREETGRNWRYVCPDLTM